MLPTLRPGARQSHCERAARVLAKWSGRKSRATTEAYGRDLEAFRRWAGASSSDEALAALLALGPSRARAAAERWRDGMAGSPRTIARRLSTLRSVVRCAQREGICPWTLEVRGPRARGHSRDTRGPVPADVGRLVAELEAVAGFGCRAGARDLAVLLLLVDCGLRRGEVCSLELRHVDRARAMLYVKEKGGRDDDRAWWPLTRRAAAALERWLRHRGLRPGPVFTACDRRMRRLEPLAPSSIYRIVRGRAEDAGLRGWRPHGLRHTGATAIQRQTGDLALAQRYLRHASPTTTAAHYLDVEPEEVRELLELVAAAMTAPTFSRFRGAAMVLGRAHGFGRGLPRGEAVPDPSHARQR